MRFSEIFRFIMFRPWHSIGGRLIESIAEPQLGKEGPRTCLTGWAGDQPRILAISSMLTRFVLKISIKSIQPLSKNPEFSLYTKKLIFNNFYTKSLEQLMCRNPEFGFLFDFTILFFDIYRGSK